MEYGDRKPFNKIAFLAGGTSLLLASTIVALLGLINLPALPLFAGFGASYWFTKNALAKTQGFRPGIRDLVRTAFSRSIESKILGSMIFASVATGTAIGIGALGLVGLFQTRQPSLIFTSLLLSASAVKGVIIIRKNTETLSTMHPAELQLELREKKPRTKGIVNEELPAVELVAPAPELRIEPTEKERLNQLKEKLGHQPIDWNKSANAESPFDKFVGTGARGQIYAVRDHIRLLIKYERWMWENPDSSPTLVGEAKAQITRLENEVSDALGLRRMELSPQPAATPKPASETQNALETRAGQEWGALLDEETVGSNSAGNSWRYSVTRSLAKPGKPVSGNPVLGSRPSQ